MLAGVIGLTIFWLDWEAPQVQLTPDLKVLGAKTTFTVKVQDQKSGLKQLRVTLQQSGLVKDIISRDFPSGWLGGGREHRFEVPLTLEPKTLGLKEGPAELIVLARDHSWRNLFNGRETTLSRQLTIDLIPLHISVRSLNHTLNQGGTGLVTYQINKDIKKSGVMVDGRWFTGYPCPGEEPGIYLAFFAVPVEVSQPFPLEVRAIDLVGNEAHQPVIYRLKQRRWRNDRINLSEAFLQKKMPEFQVMSPDLKNIADPLEVFLVINQKWRQHDNHRVGEICRISQAHRLWQGAFQRLKNSKPMAGFADHRTYFYQNREIDRQVHLGQDLASLQNAEVAAANHGVVVMAEPLGIYGQTVIIDHGWGLFSMYSHLSQIKVQTGQQVRQGEVIGNTGTTGLAGGDHLHFAMIVQGQFVDPVEWWDPHWIKDNVERQLRPAQKPQ
ncbi:MAG: M23 family metallopeptidase [Deltaproteobacteria bacterium]|nr:M23 family metallopeptidase [Deltaproteobacteria bacterium]MBW1986265.1 M23 family metallopeptidase [Deltaproteobacteria bacterium]MBW2134162.1 M23 family metallopeptidase [Deltaproteobacteria bacterium]